MLQYTVIVLLKCSGCSAVYVTPNFNSPPGCTGSLEKETEVQPQEVFISCTTNGLFPVFFNVKVTFCYFCQLKRPKEIEVLSIVTLVFITSVPLSFSTFSP